MHGWTKPVAAGTSTGGVLYRGISNFASSDPNWQLAMTSHRRPSEPPSVGHWHWQADRLAESLGLGIIGAHLGGTRACRPPSLPRPGVRNSTMIIRRRLLLTDSDVAVDVQLAVYTREHF